MNLSIIEKIKIATVIDFAKVAALGFALTLLAFTGMGTVTPAYAACDDGNFDANADPDDAGANGTAGTTEVLCGDDAAGGYDLNGFDDIGIIVTADGEADFIDATGSTNGMVLTIVDTAFDPGSDDPGLIDNNVGTGVDIVGNNNLINNGGGATIGGGTIEGSDDAIQISGFGNTVNNFNNGNGGVSIASGLINGTSDSDGIQVDGGTVGSPNVINNGMAGTGMATIQGEDDGIDINGGYVTINNSSLGQILGDAESGGAGSGINIDDDTGGDPNVTIVNDGLISTDAGNGGNAAIEIDEGSAVVDISATSAAAPGTINVTGGADAIRLESDDITLTISDQIIDADDAGGTDGDDAIVFDDSDSDNVTITDSTITAQDDGIEFTDDSDNANLTLEGTWVTAVTDHGINIEDGDDNTINLNAGTARSTNIAAANDGIFIDDGSTDTTVNINGGSAIGGDVDDSGSADGSLLTDVDADERVGGDGIDAEEEFNLNISNGGIFATGTGIAIDDGDADNDGTFGNINVGDDAGTQDAIVDALNGDGIRITGGVDDWNIDVGTDGVVRSTNGTGILIGTSEGGDDNNDVIVDGLVQSDNGSGMIVFSDDCCGGGFNGNNDTTVGATGVIRGGADGFEFVGDFNGFDSANTLTINGGAIIGGENNTAGDAGVRSSSDYSLIDNNGGTIIGLGEDTNGVVFDSDAELGGTPAYTDDAAARIIAGNIGYLVSGGSDDEDVTINGTVIAGGTGVDVAAQDCDPGDDCTITINGHVQSGATFSVAAGVDINEDGVIDSTDRATGTGKAGPGVTGTDDWDVTNNGTSVVAFSGDGLLFNDNNNITNNGLIIATDDGIDVNANNTIVNSATGVIRTGNGAANGGIDADADSNGIELGGAQNYVTNLGNIITTSNAANELDTEDPLDIDNDGMVHDGPDGTIDTAPGGDGIHAEVDNQGLIVNDGSGGEGLIDAEGDGVEVLNGNLLTYLIPDGTEQRVNNINGALINAKESGIKASNFNHILNDGDSTINADSDETGAAGTEAGIMVGDQNTVVNAGQITSGAGDGGFIGLADGIVAGNLNGYGWGSITNSGTIDVGGNAIVLGSNNFVTNSGSAAGDINGLLISGQIGNQVSSTGTLEGGGPNSNPDGTDGAGINVTSSISNQILGGGTVTSQAGSGGDGIRVSSSIATSIIQGDVTGDDDGIVIDQGSTTTSIIASSATGTTGHGVEINAASTNTVSVTGDVLGGDDGVNITNSVNNAVLVTGGITGTTGDGVDISGGSNNTVTAVGAISGDPGVVITNSSNNTVTGASISGALEGVVITNGNSNVVSSTTGSITGATADGVRVSGSDNTVTSAATIVSGTVPGTGDDGVEISGSNNTVTAVAEIVGFGDSGVEISGTSNVVSAGGTGIGGNVDGVAITSGTQNSVTTGGAILGLTGTGADIDSSNNIVTAGAEISGGSLAPASVGLHGVDISGSNNVVSAGTFILGTGGTGALVSGSGNDIDATAGIIGLSGDGVTLSGNGNDVAAGAGIAGSVDGVDANGTGNIVNAGGAVSGTSGDGVNFNGSNNTLNGATTIDGGDNGAVLNGTGNTVAASGAITGAGDEGIDIDGSSNNVSANGISGANDGVEIDGTGNTVDAGTGGIASTSGGSGVDIEGSSNNVSATGNISSASAESDDAGVLIGGNNNAVTTAGSISSGNAGVAIDGGNNNTVTAGDDAGVGIAGGGASGLYIDGNNNTATTTGSISGAGAGSDGVEIVGSSNAVSGTSVTGAADGVQADGDANIITLSGGVTGTTQDGIVLSGDGNNVTAGGTVMGGDDGVDIDGNTNTVGVTGNIEGGAGDGVDITGSSNIVTATGGISGDPGVIIAGNLNSVTADVGISGTDGGVDITGSGNIVSTGGGIEGNDDFNFNDTGDAVTIVGDTNVVTAVGTLNGENGAIITGSGNQLTAGTIFGTDAMFGGFGSGLTIDGSGNTVTTTVGGISGTDDGVEITGDSNNVSANGGITGSAGDGVDITGTSNIVTATGAISGDPGVIIAGNLNSVSSASVSATEDAISITGDQNNVSTGAISSTNDDGVDIDGDGNTVSGTSVTGAADGVQADGNANIITLAGSVEGTAQDGVFFNGDGNQLTGATSITGGDNGVVLTGAGNSVSASGTITGEGDEGVDINGSSNTVTAGGVQGDNDGVEIDGSTNTVNVGATGISSVGGGSGVDIDGDGNVVTSGVGGITTGSNELDDAGVLIVGSGNSVTSGGTVSGGNDGVNINGSTNTVGVTGDITGTNGDGVDITGNANQVTATGAISGDPGVIISGNQNSVSGASISAANDAVAITGDQNNVASAGGITSTSGQAVNVDGDSNIVSAGGTIDSNSESTAVDLNGNANQVTADRIESAGTAVNIDGGGNIVTVTNAIVGNTSGSSGSGVVISGGTNNQVSSQGISAGSSSIAVDINTDDNNVDAGTGAITGGTGVDIDGNQNNVSGASVNGTNGDGVNVTGNQNDIDINGTINGSDNGTVLTGDQNIVTANRIDGNGDEGLEINGNQNSVTVGDEIEGFWDGLDLTGNSNTVSADDFTGENGDGIDIDGNNNIINVGSTITAGQDGIQLSDTSTGNIIDITGVVISAGDDGIDAYDASNTIVTDANTTIDADDDGIVLGSPGIEGIPQFLIWNGTIWAGDDGITADADGNLTTNGNYWTIINNGTINADAQGPDGSPAGAPDDDGVGIKVYDNNLVINSAGANITGSDGIMVNDNNDVRNFGDIDVTDDGIIANDDNTILNESDLTINADDDGIVANDGNTITNTGTINADTDNDDNGTGIVANDNNEITHSGAITGHMGIDVNDDNTLDSSGTIVTEEDGIQANDDNEIDVSGNITSASGDGIELNDRNTLTNSAIVTVNSGDYALNAGDDNTMTNSGTLQAEDTAVAFQSGNTLTNSGTIQGDTAGGSGDGVVGNHNNVINNTGTIDANGGDAIRLLDGNTINSSGTIDGSQDGINVDDNNVINLTGGVVNAGRHGIQAGFGNDIDVHNSSGVNADVHGIRLLEGSNNIYTTDNITGNLQGGDGDGFGAVGEGNGIDVGGNSDNNVITISSATVRGNKGIHFDNGADSTTTYNYGNIFGEEVLNDDGDGCTGCAGDANDSFSHGILIAQGVGHNIYNYSSGVIRGAEDGVNMNGNSNDIFNYGLIEGGDDLYRSGDGVSINGNSNRVFNYGSGGTIYGIDFGIRVSGDNNYIYNSSNDTIEGEDNDGIIFSSGNNLVIDNVDGTIIGQDDGIDIDTSGSVFILNDGGLIEGFNDDGIESSSTDLNVTNQTQNLFMVGEDIGVIYGDNNGISSFNGGASITNNTKAQIIGEDDDGIYLSYTSNYVYNDGLIQGYDDGISLNNVSNGTNTIYNDSNGEITGNDSGIVYASGYGYSRTLNITNYGLIEVTGDGDLPDGFGDQMVTEVDLDLINGTGAYPVAAIDTRNGSMGLTVNILNERGGVIQGANEFDEVEDEQAEAAVLVQTTNRFAILGGDGEEHIDNFGTINGDIATQGGDDSLTLRTDSTFNGDADLGQTLEEVQSTNDEDMDGDIDSDDTILVDVGKDELIFDDHDSDNDADSDIIGRYDGDITEAETFDVRDSWWTTNGSITVDGMAINMPMGVDADGDGDLDSDVDFNVGTMGTTIHPGAGLDVGGIIEVPVDLLDPNDVDSDGITDEPDGVQDEDSEGNGIFELVKNSAAVLNSPVVDIRSGTLGGNGTIVTDPTARGGNGGVHAGGLLNGTAEGVLDDETNFTPPADENDPPIDDMIELGPNLEEEFTFDRLSDTPKYGTIAPGANIFKPGDDWVRDEGAGSQSLRIGTLTVVGNVTFDPKQTATLTKRTFALDDPATDGVDESDLMGVDNPDTTEVDESTMPDGIRDFTDEQGEEVITDWGGQLQIDLNDSGQGDLLNVVRSSPDPLTALVDVKVDTTGPGPADLVTQDANGDVTADEPDGVNDFMVDGMTTTEIQYADAGGPDGVPDAVVTEAQPVNDGVVTLAGRLDIVLDGEFVDGVNQNEDPIIPTGGTGCDDAPDGTPNCTETNPAYAVPDGIADRDSDGLLTPTADFRTVSYVWDIVIAEGGVVGTFDDLGFDGGPNDGAVIIGHDEEGNPVRVPLLKAYLQYLPDRVRIISIMDFAIVAMTPNQLAVGTALDNITQFGLNTDSFHEALAFLSQDPNKKDVLNVLGPEGFNAMNEVGISLAKHGEHHAYLRTIEAQGRVLDSSARVVMNVTDNSTVGASEDDNRATFWLAGQWSDTEIKGKDGFVGYDYETVAGYGGFDYLVTDNLLLGIMAGFGNTDIEYDGRGWEGDVDSWQIGGYISWFDEDWFVNAGGGVGDMDIESARDIFYGSSVGMIDRVANADYDGDFYYFYGRGGYSIDVGNDGFKITPEAGLVYTKVKQDSFSETGAGDLNLLVNEQSIESLRGTLQLRFSKYFRSGNGGGWMPYARVGISHEFEDDLRTITAAFEGAPSELFTVFGDVPRETTVIVGAGVSGQISEMFTLFLDYSGEFGGRFEEHSVTGGVRLHF